MDYNGLEIAIVGMSLRVPGANNINEFWKNLCEGKNSLTYFSDDELLKKGITQEELSDKEFVKAWGLMKGAKYFDHRFFGYLPEEAKFLDPQTRIFQEAVWEGLEDSGYLPNKTNAVIGLYTGAGENSIWKAHTLGEEQNSSLGSFYINYLNNKDYLAALTAYKLNLNGPVVSTQTACSTSLTSIHLACRGLLTGECDIAVGGGVSINSHPKRGYQYDSSIILSRDGYCRPFDNNASGTIGSEGVGIVILKRLEDAIKDKDNIKAIIKGSAINNDGSRKVGFTAPSVIGQKECISSALQASEVEPSTITFIEAHGTGTILGDPIEIEALQLSYGNLETQSIPIGSLKSNIGHLDAASGVVGLIKSVLAIQKRKLPPSINYNVPNDKIDFKNTSFFVNTELIDLVSKENYPIRAAVSSFGIGGTNAHIILEEAPIFENQFNFEPAQLGNLFLFSAKTESSLKNYLENFKVYLSENKHLALTDMAYSLSVCREEFQFRKAIYSDNTNDLINHIEGTAVDVKFKIAENHNNKPIVFVFPGQGSQYFNMSRDLYMSDVLIKERMDIGFAYLFINTGINYKEILFPKEQGFDINNTKYAQPLIFIVEYALACKMIDIGITPDYLIGHSVGEYTAACISGLMSFETTLALLVKRGDLIASLPGGAMVSAVLSSDESIKFLNKEISLAAVNGPKSVVFSGKVEHIENLEKILNSLDITNTRLKTSHAFHSSMMDEILDEFELEVKALRFDKSNIPFISNLTGVQFSDDDYNSKYWVSHLRNTVKFHDGINYIKSLHNSLVFLEVGPGNALSSILKDSFKKDKDVVITNLLRNFKEVKNDKEFLFEKIGYLWEKGIRFNWNKFYSDGHHKKVDIPTYCFDKNEFKLEVDTSLLFKQKQIKIKKTLEYLFPSWKKIHLEPTESDSNRNCIIFCDSSPLFVRIIKLLESTFDNVIQVNLGAKYVKKDNKTYELNPVNIDDYTMLFTNLKTHILSFDTILYCWPVVFESQGINKSTEIPKKAYNHFMQLHALAKECANFGYLDKVTFYLLTDSLHDVFGDGKNNFAQSTLLGYLKVITQENPSVIGVNLDVSGDKDVVSIANDIYNVVINRPKDTTIAIRDGKIWVRRFEKLNFNREDSNVLKQKGVYLVTGGLGNLGFLLSNFLIDNFDAHIIAVGRTDLAALSEKNSEKEVLLREKLNQLQKKGNITYFSTDISDEEDLILLKSNIENLHGKLDGIIHTAGQVGSSHFVSCEKLKLEDVASHFKPKVDGTYNLLKVFGNEDMDFMWTSSSTASYLGGIGYSAYSSSNIFMEHLMSSNFSQINKKIVVNFDALYFSTLEDLSLKEMEIANVAILSDEILRVFKKSFSYTDVTNIIVSKRDFLDSYNNILSIDRKSEKDENNTSFSETMKLDRQSFFNNYEEAVSDTEKQLITVWKDFFGYSNLGVTDDFYELGGDSLKALSIIKRINKDMNIEILLSDFFEFSDIKSLATHIDLNKKNKFNAKIII